MLRLLARYTIHTKVVAAFGLILCCTIGLGVFAATRVAILTDIAALIGTDVLASNALSYAENAGERLLSRGFALHSAETEAERNSLSQDVERTARVVSENGQNTSPTAVIQARSAVLRMRRTPAWKRYGATLRKLVDLEKAGSY